MGVWGRINSFIQEISYGEAMWDIVSFLGIILITILLKRTFIRFIIGLLKKLTKKTETDIDDKLLKVMEKPIGLAFTTIGFYFALRIVDIPLNIEFFIDNAAKTIILFTLFWAAYRVTNIFTLLYEVISKKTETKLDNMLLSFLENGIKIVIVIIGSITLIQVWFEEIGGILTGLGLGGLAFALAAQETASNLFGSITIMTDRPFEIGDWIKTPSVEGTVEEIGFRSTRVRTFEQAVVTIPNSLISKEAIINWSKMGKRRISFRLGVTYSTTSEQIKSCLEKIREMLKKHQEVHPETIYVYFEKFGESSLDIFIYFFTKTTNWQKYLEIQEDVNIRVMEIVKELEISIAFPSRSIYVENVDNK